MYSAKLSYFFLQVGLINQIIFALHPENEITNSIISEESTISSFTATTEETSNSIDRFDYENVLMHLKKCLKRGNSSIFDLALIQGIMKQNAEPLNLDDSLLSDETKKEIEVIFDSIIYALNNTDDSEISEPINQATELIVNIILSAKRSDMKQIIRILTESSQELLRILTIRNENVTKLIQSMDYKVVISAMLKEDPSISTYLLDFLLSIMDVIEHYEEQDKINEVIEVLKLKLQQTKKDIIQSQISNNNEIAQPLIQIIGYLSDEISYTVDMKMSDEDKFSGIRCMVEDSVMTMFLQTFWIEFASEINYEDIYKM